MTSAFELSIASQSKPFPWAPLATAVYINAQATGLHPLITITAQPVALLQPAVEASNAALTCKSEYNLLTVLLTDSGKTTMGSTAICSILSKAFPEAGLWPKELADALEFTLLGTMEKLTSTDPKSIKEALSAVNETLAFGMFPVKYSFTVADLCLWGAIKGNPLVSTEMASGRYSEVERWYKEFMEPRSVTTKVYKLIKDLSAVFPTHRKCGLTNRNPRQKRSPRLSNLRVLNKAKWSHGSLLRYFFCAICV